MTKEQYEYAKELKASGLTGNLIATMLGVSTTTYYRQLKRYEKQHLRTTE